MPIRNLGLNRKLAKVLNSYAKDFEPGKHHCVVVDDPESFEIWEILVKLNFAEYGRRVGIYNLTPIGIRVARALSTAP